MMHAMTRSLKLARDGGARHVQIRIFVPTKQKHSWECHWEIEWPERLRGNTAGGIDSPQALLNALKMIGTELYCSDEHKAGHLKWSDDWSGYGFPVPNGMRDALIGDDAKYL